MGEADEYSADCILLRRFRSEKEQLQRNFDEFFEDWTTFHDMIEISYLTK